MATGDTIIRLLKAALANDRERIETIAKAMIAEERTKQHNTLAERLTDALNATPPSIAKNLYGRAASQAPNGNGKGPRDFLADIMPRKTLNELFLSNECFGLCREVINEHNRAEILRSHGLEPRHRILLAGPPGNGKTSLAEALAYELNATFFVVRYETLIGSYLGETSARLKQVFDYAKTRPCVLFFDEFDTLGKERGDTHETGEIKRVVSSLLLQMDDLPSYTVVVTATNHPELLDRAVWRRFQIKIELPPPTRRHLTTYFEAFLSRFNEEAEYQPATLAKHLYGRSFAEAEDFCLNVLRSHVLSLGENSLKSTIARQIRQWKASYNPSSSIK